MQDSWITGLFINLLVIIFCSADMYKDGYEKRTNKIVYLTKSIMIACIFAFMWIGQEPLYQWQTYVSVLLLKKPVSDIAYTVGYFGGMKHGIYIGETYWIDKLMHKWGLVNLEYTKFPIITVLYFFMIFIGFVIGVHRPL